MRQKLLLDTSVLIEYERDNPHAIALIRQGKLATSAVAVMEFNQGKGRNFASVFSAPAR